MVMCNGIVIIEGDGRRLGLPNAPLAVMGHDNKNRTGEFTAIALNITHFQFSTIHVQLGSEDAESSQHLLRVLVEEDVHELGERGFLLLAVIYSIVDNV